MTYLVLALLLVALLYFLLMDNLVKTRRIDETVGPSLWLVQNYQLQVASRRTFLAKIPKVPDRAGWGRLYNNLAPEVFCAEKIKVGTTDDGGKWMCSPQNLPDNCVIFALGISGVISFEADIQRYSDQRCRIISVDSREQPLQVIEALNKIGGVVVKSFVIAVDSGEKMTMATILKENGATSVEILKIDIEGAEFGTLETFLEQYSPKQILVEVHGNAATTYHFLKMISSKGYHLFSFEINGQYHSNCEYSFIDRGSLERYRATLLAKYL